jgi:large subunit ribosomal protein L14
MVLRNSFIKCVDNTGAKLLKVLRIVGYTSALTAGYAGDELVVVVRRAVPNKRARLGQKYRALLIQSSTTVRRPHGDVVRGRNLAILLRATEDLPLGNRISKRYAVFREVRLKGWTKVAQLAPRLV